MDMIHLLRNTGLAMWKIMNSKLELARIGADNCQMECPIGKDKCGGKLAMNVFYTGVTVKKEKQAPKIVEQVRVVFILTVSGIGFV